MVAPCLPFASANPIRLEPIQSDSISSPRNATRHINALGLGPYFGSFSPSRDTSLDYLMNVTMAKEV